MTAEQFWQSDFGELQDYFDIYAENEKARDKERVATTYNLACMIAQFVCSGLNGKKPPSINTLYPDLFTPDDLNKFSTNRLEHDMFRLAGEWNKNRRQRGNN